MSRGLGWMQYRIMEELKNRPGGDAVGGDKDLLLKKGIHDLRVVSLQMAQKFGGILHGKYTTERWQASFSRAVKGLHKRGQIEVWTIAPIAYINTDYVYPYPIHELADGFYLLWHGRQRRFVSVKTAFITLKNKVGYF